MYRYDPTKLNTPQDDPAVRWTLNNMAKMARELKRVLLLIIEAAHNARERSELLMLEEAVEDNRVRFQAQLANFWVYCEINRSSMNSWKEDYIPIERTQFGTTVYHSRPNGGY
jgi:hypothetical protein